MYTHAFVVIVSAIHLLENMCCVENIIHYHACWWTPTNIYGVKLVSSSNTLKVFLLSFLLLMPLQQVASQCHLRAQAPRGCLRASLSRICTAPQRSTMEESGQEHRWLFRRRMAPAHIPQLSSFTRTRQTTHICTLVVIIIIIIVVVVIVIVVVSPFHIKHLF